MAGTSAWKTLLSLVSGDQRVFVREVLLLLAKAGDNMDSGSEPAFHRDGQGTVVMVGSFW